MLLKVGDIIQYFLDNEPHYGVVTATPNEFVIVRWFNEASTNLIGTTIIAWGYGQLFNKVS